MPLSGNGRHRRPRPTPRFVIAAGVTGAGVALPLMGATGAHAASGSTWDKVALCESGNNWSLNTGNGFYGGLQFSTSTWAHYGGKQYAARPDLASRLEQIAVGEKVLADQGPGAWPACGLKAGLAKGGPAPETPQPAPPGGLGQHDPEPGPAPSAPTHRHPAAPPASSASPSHGASMQPPGPSTASPSASPSGTQSGSPDAPRAPKHAGPSADETPSADRSGQGLGRHRADLDGNVLPGTPTGDGSATPSPRATAGTAARGPDASAVPGTGTGLAPSGNQYGLALGGNLARIAQGAHLDLPVQP